MSKNAFSHLDVTSRVVKRAQYEALEFTVQSEGVRVRNNSHAEPSEHEYLVTIAEGVPASCTCPADANYEGACKHRAAVAIRKPVLDAAVHQQLAADGGPNVTTSESGLPKPTLTERIVDEPGSETDASLKDKDEGKDEDEDEDEGDCDCADLSSDFPCWECYLTGRRDLPER